MKKRSSFQIAIDRNQNIRISNLSLTEFSEIFDDCFMENKNNIESTFEHFKNVKFKSNFESDLYLVTHLYESCEICFRQCRVNRNKDEKGSCKLTSQNNVYMTTIINDDEKLICPTYAIYLSSCNISCEYCHQKHIMIPGSQKYISLNYIVDEILNNLNLLKTISFIGGDPDLSFLTIMRIIALLSENKIDLPLVLNSNFLFNEKLYPLIDEYFEVLIPDFKFWDDECSKTLCGFPDYKRIVQKNILYFLNKKQMIIRHLPLPGHWKCCSKPIIDWISDQAVNKELCSSAFLDLLQSDNSKNILECKKYAKKFKIDVT